MKNVTVVIPTINEPAIKDVVTQAFEVLGDYNVEVLVVDKSTDDTPRRAEEAGARIISQVGIGYGDAYLTGFDNVSEDCDYVVMLDGDNTYDPTEIPKLLAPLEANTADMVMGDRFAAMEEGAMGFRNRFGNRLLTRFINILYKADINDTQSGFRAFRAQELKVLDMNAEGMPFATEMIIESIKSGVRIQIVPIVYRKRIGEPKLKAYKDATLIIGLAVRLVRDYNPLSLFLPLGILFVGAGIAVGVSVVLDWIQTGQILRLASTILSALFIMMGLQILFFGLLADIILSALRKHRHGK